MSVKYDKTRPRVYLNLLPITKSICKTCAFLKSITAVKDIPKHVAARNSQPHLASTCPCCHQLTSQGQKAKQSHDSFGNDCL